MKFKLFQATALVATIALVPVATGAMAAVDTDTYKQMDKFLDVYNRVKADYVDKVTDEQLIRGAIDGMLSALDPHSSYVDGRDFDNLRIQTEGNYGGLGLSVTMEDGAVKVIAPQEDTPAAKAGLKPGDYITHIDGKLLYGSTLDEAVAQMRGKPGTKIALTIVRPGRDKPIDVTLTREVIVQRPVKWQIKGDVGYIDINTFSETTGADTRAAANEICGKIRHAGAACIVLRNRGVRG